MGGDHFAALHISVPLHGDEGVLCEDADRAVRHRLYHCTFQRLLPASGFPVGVIGVVWQARVRWEGVMRGKDGAGWYSTAHLQWVGSWCV